MKTSTIYSSPQIFLQEQDYHLINNERDQIILEFRAPPPSPTGSSRRTSSVTNDGILSDFLENTLRVPNLILPNKIFPNQKPYKNIPIIDFERIKDEFITRVEESFEELGCFQVINHGISEELMKTVARRGARVFRMSEEKKRKAVRSSETVFGFEDVGCDQDEVFVWGRNLGFKVKMEGILPTKYSKFSTKMESLASAIEKVAKDIMLIMINGRGEKLIGKNHHANDNNTICHIYKHPCGVTVDQCISSLQYDVIRTMIRGSDYSHALSFHICHDSSEFHVYSKKGWTSFVPLENALVVTFGDQIQALSGGRSKHVIGKAIYINKNRECISMAFLFTDQTNMCINGPQMENTRIISLRNQALFAIFFTIAFQFLLYFYNILKHS